MSDDLFKRLKAALTDRYAVESELDRGGMAVVYLAKDLRHDRKVAIKVLDPSLSATLATERFLREIDVIAKLEHPHILTLIDSGEVEGLPYYVMPYVKGHSLAALLEKERRLPLAQALRIAAEVAEALETAHQQGVIHRDIKPSNVLLSGGHAVVADFGIAAALDESKLGRLTVTGSSLGSPIYMSPEQAVGERELDARTDIYALGCMVYEMLGGEPPFDGSLESVVSRKVLGEFRPLKEICPEVPPEVDKAVSKALAREADKRFATAGEFRDELLAGMPVEVPKGWGRKRTLATAAALLVVVAVATVTILHDRAESRRVLWASQTLGEIEDSILAGQLTEAYLLAQEVEAVFPEDTTLARFVSMITFSVPIRTDPPGARVFIQEWEGSGGEWEFLGVTPLEDVRFVGTNALFEDRPHRLRFELEGYQTRELLKLAVTGGAAWRGIPTMDTVKLSLVDPETEGMVLLPGATWGAVDGSVPFADYFMGRFEVTNQEFKEFVDADGYRSPEYWVHPFVQDGAELGFEEAMAFFRDQSGRPGPSTWSLGSFPEGQAEYPVGGVSWFEAAAFARWAGKELPTTDHWWGGVRHSRESSYLVLPRSNLESTGPRPVGQNEAMTVLGIYDMAGNVREWCHNEAEEGQRATMGGAWTDGDFHVGWVIPKPAFDRHETNGFRLVRTFDDEETLASLRFREERTVTRDFRAERPVSDAQFEFFRGLYDYDPVPLHPVVEKTDTMDYWVRQKISFDLPYGERGGVVLFLPLVGEPPFQTVIYWGGSNILAARSSDDMGPGSLSFLILDGKAVARPIFKGAYERDDSLFSITHGSIPGGRTGPTYRDFQIQWVKDLTACIDYLETRPDMDPEGVGYFGFSFGGQTAPIPLAVDDRIKAAVLNVGGLSDYRYMPEIDPFNFVTRVRQPVLMINGRYDIVFPFETMQLPMYELLGTPAEDKRHYVSEASHLVPRDEVIRETLAWFDKYLGGPGEG